jgi:asparagine synthase (glutamine-hydrolysing)
MCGIFGIVALVADRSPDPHWLEAMEGVTVHRGPDEGGAYIDGHVALAMRRLSIIDLSTGRQPIANEDESLWIVCNGEIYNFAALRDELIQQGHRFRTNSDSEVLLHLYEQHDLDFVRFLNGMFAFALWDSRRRRLVVGRDRLGIKPLYYFQSDAWLMFASEAKALVGLPPVGSHIDPSALREYLALGYVGGDRSLFRGVRKLPPASLLIHEQGRSEIRRYWNLPMNGTNPCPEAEWAERLRDSLDNVIASEMVSDVPIGAFLSGGLDSSCIVAMMARHSTQPVRTYSIGFDGGKAGAFYNELGYARQVAAQFNTQHFDIIVRPSVIELMPKLLWHLDEPIADSAFITTYLVAQVARQEVKVILSGVGGDELFGGYNRYLGDYYLNAYRRLPAALRRSVIQPIVGRLPSDRHSRLTSLARYARIFVASHDQPFEDRYRSYVEVFDRSSVERLVRIPTDPRPDALDEAFAMTNGGDNLQRMMQVDMLTQLPNDLLALTDKMTMAVSLECRVPLINHRLVELTASIPSPMKIQERNLKHVFKRALEGVLPKTILQRSKRGFGAPIGAWLKSELAPLVQHLLSEPTVSARGWLDPAIVRQTISDHEADRADNTDRLLALISLEMWARLYLDRVSPADLTEELKATCPA